MTAIKLLKNVPNAKIIAHGSLFRNKEYADYTNIFWKQILKWCLKFFFRLRIITKKNKILDESEKLGLISSLFSIVEDSSAGETKYPFQYNELYNLSLGAKDLVDYIREHKVQTVYIFNGRTAGSYLVAKYCSENDVNILYYEYAGHSNGFRLYENIPHALVPNGKAFLNYYKNGVYSLPGLKYAAKIIKAQKLLHDVKQKTTANTNSQYDVLIFLGSDFEYTGVDPSLTGVRWYGNANFCKQVISKFGKKKYAIRCHPNSEIDPNWPILYKELKGSLSFHEEYIDFYGPDSEIDSHSLIMNSRIAVTDLSSIALDVILLGKKVEIFGNTDVKFIYENDWLNNQGGEMADKIIFPFALVHNTPVFRFSLFEILVANILYIVHRSFQKISN